VSVAADLRRFVDRNRVRRRIVKSLTPFKFQ